MNQIDLVLCRPGLEEACRDEIIEATASPDIAVAGPGQVRLSAGVEPTWEFIFVRQRLPQSRAFALNQLHPPSRTLVDAAMEGLAERPGLWTVHALTAGVSSVRPDGLRRAMEREISKREPALRKRLIDPAKAWRKHRVAVVQVLAAPDQGWLSVAAIQELPSPHPGGIFRMPLDPAAPSRSYLKLEEAFHLMHAAPHDGDRVIDLGAAPGGWTYACLKRGARVTAVDNGPLKLQDPDRLPGRLDIIRANGLTWRPPLPTADWLLSDMLIPPGPALGRLKTWMGDALCRHLVMTIKLPQQQIWPALKPVIAWLDRQAGWSVLVKHLYHNRREVTVMARAFCP